MLEVAWLCDSQKRTEDWNASHGCQDPSDIMLALDAVEECLKGGVWLG